MTKSKFLDHLLEERAADGDGGKYAVDCFLKKYVLTKNGPLNEPFQKMTESQVLLLYSFFEAGFSSGLSHGIRLIKSSLE